MATENWVAEAVRRLGGPSATQRRLYAEKGVEVSESTIYRWTRDRWVNDVRAAFALADMTGISARLLAGLDASDGPPPSNGGVTVSEVEVDVTSRARRTRSSSVTGAQLAA